ncbi:MAG: TetR/AcrR family transcriptional regulator [Candidatus Dormibacteraeota bacterium]|nr:TetR/AcrR family transcriptional regulator [Candidatus Dormibacteraeota bacterium]
MARHDASPTHGTRERILEVALELFSEAGYDKTSLREVAERVGVTKAALYYHFPSKESVLMALIERAHSLGDHGLDLLPGQTILETPAELARFALHGIDTVMAQRPLFVLMERNRSAIGSLHTDDPEHLEVHRQMEERWTAYLQDPDLPLRLRVRLAASLGAVMACAVGSLRGLGAESQAGLRSELASAVMDLLEIPEADRPPLAGVGEPAP